jgi:hypothetical protein
LRDIRAIARALGGEVIGRDQVAAPGPGHSRKDRSLSVRLLVAAPDGFLIHSHAGDNWRECRDHVRRSLGIPDDQWREKPENQPVTKSRPGLEREMAQRQAWIAATVAQILTELRPILGSPGEAYLRAVRGIDAYQIADVLERTDAIGWHSSVLFRETGHELNDKRIGAIVAVMTDPSTTKPTGAISRTYLHHGRKLGKAKTLGRGGGVCRLSLDEDVLAGLFLSEGLETALSAMALGLRPMWSTGSASVMAEIPILGGIESLTVLADNDSNKGAAGERAAREVGCRWLNAGRDVRILIPPEPGTDFNDMLSELL